MTINATPKAADANSYTTVSEADTHLTSNRLYTDAWTNAGSDDQEKALIWATVLLDRSMEWYGTPRDVDQHLRWPRSGVMTEDRHDWYDYDTIPAVLKEATAEMALELLRQDRTVEPELIGQGFIEAKLGDLEAKVDPNQTLDLVPHYIRVKLYPLGYEKPINSSGGTKQVRVRRT